MNKKIVAGLAVLVLMLGVGWYFGSPYWTLRQMREAAVERNVDELAEHVDFERVRTSLKEQMNAIVSRKMAEEQAKNPDNPFVGLGAMMGTAIVNNMVDAIVTKEGMRQMFIAGRPRGPEQQQEKLGEPVDFTIERDGLDRFTVTPKEEGPQGSFIFERDGLGWKLVEVRIPEEGFAGE